MMGLAPLVLLWAMTRNGAAAPRGQSPRWPGQKHPPPAKPKAKRKAAPARPTAPRAPAPPAGPAPPPPVDAASHAPPLAEVPRTPSSPAPAPPKPGARYAAVSVLDVQRIANKLGARPALKPDGLYGPKTVAAWRAAARARKLGDSIVRLGPKTVDVDARTLSALKQTALVSGREPELYIP